MELAILWVDIWHLVVERVAERAVAAGVRVVVKAAGRVVKDAHVVRAGDVAGDVAVSDYHSYKLNRIYNGLK